MIGADGIENYITLKIDKEEKDRGLKDVLYAFDTYRRPKRNETIEMFRLNVRKQEPGLTIKTFKTDLKHKQLNATKEKCVWNSRCSFERTFVKDNLPIAR